MYTFETVVSLIFKTTVNTIMSRHTFDKLGVFSQQLQSTGKVLQSSVSLCRPLHRR